MSTGQAGHDQERKGRAMPVRFFHPKGPNGWLSNFSPHAVDLDGQVWPTAEHLYQALKFPHDAERRQRIRDAKSPGLAKRIAHEREAQPSVDWDSRKVDAMRQVLRLKFAQHPDLAEKLLNTADRRLVEHRTRDAFWGDGGDDSGQNWLGQLLMEMRKELQTGASTGVYPSATLT